MKETTLLLSLAEADALRAAISLAQRELAASQRLKLRSIDKLMHDWFRNGGDLSFTLTQYGDT